MPADPWTTQGALGAAESTTATFMAAVYRWMAAGLALTGLVAYGVASSPSMMHTIFSTPLMWGLIIGQLVLVMAFTRVSRTATFPVAAAMFLAYCALSGVTFASIIYLYTRESIATTFFITGGSFFALSAYGTLTKRDLSVARQFLMMGLVGVLIASLVNIFMHSSAMSFMISFAGVIVFAGLTAYDTQKIRAMAHAGDERLALNGALSLYLDFVNLFLMLLRFFGRRR